MKLSIVTPLDVAVQEDGILALRAEDASGGFGILPGHADFMTSLAIAVVDWKRADGSRHYCAVRGGLLSVTDGQEIAIATRQAVPGADLLTLQDVVLARFRTDLDSERKARADSTALEIAAIRQIMRRLAPHKGAVS